LVPATAADDSVFIDIRRLEMAIDRRIRILAVATAVLCTPCLAVAQNAPATSSLKTIGAPSFAAADVAPSLIVLNARGATLQGQKLTLSGVTPNAIVFADRPVRAAGHDLTTHIIEDWGTGSDSFASDPPNATVSVFSKDGASVKDAVVVLKSPKLDGDQLTFDVEILEGSLAGADGAASVFIDRFGFAYRGVGRVGVGRVGYGGAALARRGVWYRGAAVGAAVGAAAVGAAAYGAYGAPACGYYPYPPCY
jgi:hypothetical protein